MPYADIETRRRRSLEWYHHNAEAVKEKRRIYRREHFGIPRELARQAKKRSRFFSSAKQRLAAIQMRTHTVMPDGDLDALRERITQECKQWST